MADKANNHPEYLELAEVGHEVFYEANDVDGEYRLSKHTYLTLFFMGITWGTCTLVNVGPSSTYSYSIAELGGASIESWIPNAALIPLIGLQPVWGGLADRFGKKWFVVAGGLAGLVGNLVAATAKITQVLIFGQALSGVGSSLFLLVIPASMEIVPAKYRSFAQGGMGLINGLMSIIGLIAAGGFAKMSLSGWRWVYYFNAIFFAISGIAMSYLYRPPPTKLRRENETVTQLMSIDYIGIALLLVGVIGIITSLTWGGNAYTWNSPQVLSLLVIGVVFIVLFGVYETWFRTDGLLDHRFFESRNYALVMSVALIDGMILYGVNSFLAIEASELFTSNPIKVNLYLLPLNVLVLVGIFVSSYVLGITKRYRILLSGSVFLIALFCGLSALVTASRVVMLLIFTGLIGLGVGVTTVIPVVIVSYAVPSHLLGTAGTLFASVRALGGAIGITAFAVIFSNSMSAHLASGVVRAAIKAGLPASEAAQFAVAFIGGNTSELATIEGVTSAVTAAAGAAEKSVVAQSFRFVWVALAIFGACAGILTVFLEPVKDRMTVHVESALEDGKLRQTQMTS